MKAIKEMNVASISDCKCNDELCGFWSFKGKYVLWGGEGTLGSDLTLHLVEVFVIV